MIYGHDPHRQLDAIFINSPLKDYDASPRRNSYTLPVLGLGYIATCASESGLNVGVLDSEALGLGVEKVAQIVNAAAPRWVGLNLLAPTYRQSVAILRHLSPDIKIMLGGHHARAMPQQIIQDRRIPRIDALIIGEAEHRVEYLLADLDSRGALPFVYWRSCDGAMHEGKAKSQKAHRFFLAPDINGLPLVNRRFFSQDPFKAEDGRIEADLVGSRGCPYNCTFCGAARKSNPDITIRTRDPSNILEEMTALARSHQVSAFRFVDDLFLGQTRFIKRCLGEFVKMGVADKWVWDATGRVNVIAHSDHSLLSLIKQAGCREIAFGIESGSARVLKYIHKLISPAMALQAVKALTSQGIHVKGYFILGFPSETEKEMMETITLIKTLWDSTQNDPGNFRCSVFEYRPYPGTEEWSRLLASGKYSQEQLLNYEYIDFTEGGRDETMYDRDEFNYSVNLQFGDVPIARIRKEIAQIMKRQKLRSP